MTQDNPKASTDRPTSEFDECAIRAGNFDPEAKVINRYQFVAILTEHEAENARLQAAMRAIEQCTEYEYGSTGPRSSIARATLRGRAVVKVGNDICPKCMSAHPATMDCALPPIATRPSQDEQAVGVAAELSAAFADYNTCAMGADLILADLVFKHRNAILTALRAKPADEGLRELLREAAELLSEAGATSVRLEYSSGWHERRRPLIKRINAALEQGK